MGTRTLNATLAICICLSAARTALADSVDFQSAAGSGSAQTSQSGGHTSQGGAAGTQVQTVDLGDVTGTVCDCGEITPAAGESPAAGSKGGFPKFPLLALAVLPALPPPGNPAPTPFQPPPPSSNTPEPLTLVTLASGLVGLGALRSRRRHG